MNTQLRHIFDESSCLTRRQIKEYVEEYMGSEEAHAAEHHINCCPLCSLAIEGLGQCEEGVAVAFSQLNNGFLTEHFNTINPQVHLNSIGPVAHPQPYRQQPKAQPVWRNTSIAAVMVLLCGLWYFEKHSNNNNSQISAATLPAQSATPAVANKTEERELTNTSTVAPAHNVAVASLEKDKKISKPGNNDNKQKSGVLLMAGKKHTDVPANTIAAETLPGDVPADVITSTTPAQQASTDEMDNGLKLYDKKDYTGALSEFKKGMNSTDAGKKHEALIMSARCYQNMGKDDEAQKLLKEIKE